MCTLDIELRLHYLDQEQSDYGSLKYLPISLKQAEEFPLNFV